MKNTLSTDNYKGVRDFYPKDMFIQEYIFDTWKEVAESFGFEQYNASILESNEIYKAKTSEEIVNEQTYTFTDRGGREVTLRPEMTPTVARMIAAKRRELSFPVKWYSIPNVFRYERPQRGRLREHWQLNADIFGVAGVDAEIEMISFASKIMDAFGLQQENFTIKINNRKLVDTYLAEAGLDDESSKKVKRLIDRKNKIDDFEQQLEGVAGKDFKYNLEADSEIEKVLDRLKSLGINNVEFDPYLMRGFDYYTGIVFEVFDNNPENSRSIFGGGRYDNLTKIFGEDNIPAFGFGMGDVTMRDVLETYNLLPNYTHPAFIYICPLSEGATEYAQELASSLRDNGLPVSIDYSGKKIGDMISSAYKQGIPYMICIGEEEIKTRRFVIKELETRKEKKVRGLKGIIKYFR